MSTINVPVEAVLRLKEQQKPIDVEVAKRDKILSQLENYKDILKGTDYGKLLLNFYFNSLIFFKLIFYFFC